jgi:hypothetical protein
MHLDTFDIENLVNQRIRLRKEREYTKADEIKIFLERNDIVLTDLPFKEGGGTIWTVKSSFHLKKPMFDESWIPSSFMEFCHQLYDFRRTGLIKKDEEVLHIIKKFLKNSCIDNEESNPDHEVQGRKFADAAFEIAMAGIKSNEIFNLMVTGAKAELNRFGHRHSCRFYYILFLHCFATTNLIDK